MSEKSSIEWCDATWNPVRGCTKISPGCKNCYAETFAERWRGVPGHPYEQGFGLRLVPEKLDEPLGWKKPRRVFVNSMSDLFQEGVPFEFVDQVFAIMAATPQHTYQILTKRADRMLQYLKEMENDEKDMHRWQGETHAELQWPLPNVWLGVSAENQEYFDDRVEKLGLCPAAVRFVSIEPMLGAIDAGNAFDVPPEGSEYGQINWVIVGGESGSRARPFEIRWARDIIMQCKAADVPVFLKQLGANAHERNDRIADIWFYSDGSDMDTAAVDADSYRYQGASLRLKLKSPKGGDMSEWPKNLRVREFPK